jgi:hypothetical protein
MDLGSLGEGKRPLDSGSARRLLRSALERCSRASSPASPTSGRSEHEQERHLTHRRERTIEKSMKTRSNRNESLLNFAQAITTEEGSYSQEIIAQYELTSGKIKSRARIRVFPKTKFALIQELMWNWFNSLHTYVARLRLKGTNQNHLKSMNEKSPKIAPKITGKEKLQIWRGEQVVHEFNPYIYLLRGSITSHSSRIKAIDGKKLTNKSHSSL